MDRAVEIKFSDEAREVYTYLTKKAASSKLERSLLNAINRKIELIKRDPSMGDSIAKVLIPQEYRRKYLVKSLYRVELPNYWRMLYTISDEELKVIAFIIDVVDHKEYGRKFGYKK